MFGQVMAEYVIGQIIASERRFYDMYDCQRSGQWAKDRFKGYCRPLSSVSVGILGVGDIGMNSEGDLRLCSSACSYCLLVLCELVEQ